MKDEIKEILSYLKKKENTRRIKCITIEESKQLLDYITNLQEERNSMACLVNDLQEIKDEAMEYIEKGNKHFKENYNEPYEYAFMVNADEIMKILKGKSDE